MDNILDFVNAALPWIAIGLLVAVFCVRKVRKTDRSTPDSGDEGMCIGMAVGTALGAIGVIDIGISMTFGMLIGLLIGSFIKKRENIKRGEKSNDRT